LRISLSILFSQAQRCALVGCEHTSLCPRKRKSRPRGARRRPDRGRKGELLRLPRERGGVDGWLLRRARRLADERALLAELLEAQAGAGLAAGIAADAVRSAALVLDDAAAGIVELEEGGADVPLGRLV